MKTLALPFAALVCLTLSGCAPTSIDPLYTKDDAVVEPALEGTWIDADKPDDSPIVLRKSGTHEYTMSLIDSEKKSAQNYDVNLVRLGDELYMDIAFSDQTLDGNKLDLPLGTIPTHEIVKIRVTGDTLAYATLDSEQIKKQNQWDSQPLALADADQATLIAAPTADLRHYITIHTDEVFGDFEHLTRKPPAPQP
jgi:hypothetical protein